ncbi:MAG: bifunctional folylpolyglutamate synthase/dihydrofolate synthase [Kiritimatiellaceae bacterium]|nr:bifunctional folylpolyglutamate synthase/dihydrofolate synthase [Kiritimatiellaceae bacterium]
MNRSEIYERLFRRTTAGIKPGLEVISALLETLDNPHQQLAVIHVAGTNGKGSVCAMLESVLRASGFKTGLYTSPHLVNFSERFRVSGEEISEEKLNGYIQTLEKIADQVEESTGVRAATFFEISTAIAFQYFVDEKVDIAIIETGMGGRWDATNVVIPLISVITHIDIDHTNFLGDSIEEIAAEKAGIIKPGRPVVSAPQSEGVMEVLRKSGQSIDAASSRVAVNLSSARNAAGSRAYNVQKLKIETHSINLPPINFPLLGECQRENCAVAVATLEVLADMLDVELSFKKGLESVEWGARFQCLETDPLMILDGAHNPSAARALVKTLKENFPKHQIGFILGFLDDKDSVEFLREIKAVVSKVWTVSIDAPRGSSAEESAMQCEISGIESEPVETSNAWNSAKEWASENSERLIVATGSLYLKQVLGL